MKGIHQSLWSNWIVVWAILQARNILFRRSNKWVGCVWQGRMGQSPPAHHAYLTHLRRALPLNQVQVCLHKLTHLLRDRLHREAKLHPVQTQCYMHCMCVLQKGGACHTHPTLLSELCIGLPGTCDTIQPKLSMCKDPFNSLEEMQNCLIWLDQALARADFPIISVSYQVQFSARKDMPLPHFTCYLHKWWAQLEIFSLCLVHVPSTKPKDF